MYVLTILEVKIDMLKVDVRVLGMISVGARLGELCSPFWSSAWKGCVVAHFELNLKCNVPFSETVLVAPDT
jgi:hypothetical protein